MTIIKQDQVDMGGHTLASIEIEDFDRRAETLIATAQQAAQDIIEAARREDEYLIIGIIVLADEKTTGAF